MAEVRLQDAARRIALVVHPTRPAARKLADVAREYSESRGHVVVEDDAAAPSAHFAPPHPDLVVSLGGDGTMLRTVHMAAPAAVPVLGVNLGALGYLASVEPDALEVAFGQLERGEYAIEDRMTLDVTYTGPDRSVTTLALNEAVIERTGAGHTIHLQVVIGGKDFLSYVADGFLVTSPSGSTAYNLSLRGPIVSPRLRAVVLTPIAPHMLFDRSIVLEPESEVRLELLDGRSAQLVVDGLEVTMVEPGDTIAVHEGAHPARLVTLEMGDFYGVLRSKFNLANR